VRPEQKGVLELFFCRECREPKYETGSEPLRLGSGRPKQRELCCGHRVAWANRPIGLLSGQRYLDGKVS